MKIVWAPEDIWCGLRVGRDGDTLGKGMIVGFDPKRHTSANPALCLVSLDDGMIIVKGQSHEEIAEWLTKNNELPIEVLGRRKAET